MGRIPQSGIAVFAMYADIVAALCERRLFLEYEPAVIDRRYSKRAGVQGPEGRQILAHGVSRGIQPNQGGSRPSPRGEGAGGTTAGEG
jgi:hypothetical protein